MVTPARFEGARQVVMLLRRGEGRVTQDRGNDLDVLGGDDRDICRGAVAEEMRVQRGAEGGLCMPSDVMCNGAIIELNFRSLVGGIERGGDHLSTDFVDEMISKLVGGAAAPEIWRPCLSCTAQSRCSIRVSAEMMGASTDPAVLARGTLLRRRLFKAAQDRARRPLRGKGGFLKSAQRRAERLGRRHQLTPFQVFDFLVGVDQIGAGAAVAKLGLWPIIGDELPSDADLDLSAALAERLLFAHDDRSLGDRVRALLLDDPDGGQAPALELFLREAAGCSPIQALERLVARPELWLGALQPRFSGTALRALRLASWRTTASKLVGWSGLQTSTTDADDKPHFVLDREAPVKEQGRLEIRWTTEPDELPQGSVDYRLVIMAGEEEIAEQSVAHKEKGPQRAVFSIEYFEHLNADAKFEAFVQVSAIGVQDVESVQSEEFVLEFGKAEGKSSATSGKVERSLVDGAIVIASRAAFDDALLNGHIAPRVTEDKKGFISWGIPGGRSVRVLRPALIRQVEEDWQQRNGAPGRWILKIRSDGSPVGFPTFESFEPADRDSSLWDRVVEASRKLAADLGPYGLLSRIQAARWPIGDAYVNAWAAALEAGAPSLSLHGTVEVRSLSGRTLGLIVTPLHPLRLLWHGAYDQLMIHARYEQVLTPTAGYELRAARDDPGRDCGCVGHNL
jgi:DNA phosphorothioation-dependent restriction protein DptH